MDGTISRRGFFGLAPVFAIPHGVDLGSVQVPIHTEFPSQNPTLIRETVGAAHADLPKLRGLVEGSPALANASWDWGFGDWESAIGAAAHMGRRDIAEFLIQHGARPDLFTFAMLGNLEAVKAIISKNPGIQSTLGPHNITMLAHARNGGEAAKPVLDYLIEIGKADERAMSLSITEAEKEMYLGRYSFGPGKNDALDVVKNNQGSLAIKRGDYFPRVLNRVEEHAFAPGGAPKVRVRFKVESGRAVSLTVHDPTPLVTATRSAASIIF